ncbi:MAG TPA: ATP-binding protein [Tepidisphaeraceae bacterium]|nr:ATP-binding protein [Tepidisphaeraceae bacterium]
MASTIRRAGRRKSFAFTQFPVAARGLNVPCRARPAPRGGECSRRASVVKMVSDSPFARPTPNGRNGVRRHVPRAAAGIYWPQSSGTFGLGDRGLGAARRFDRTSRHRYRIGISAEQHGSSFEEFYQVGNYERDRQKGFGLGLAIARRLARQLGGDITLESAAGCGSRFTVALPGVVAGAGAAAQPGAEPVAV